MSLLTTIAGLDSALARPIEARGLRASAPVVEIEPPHPRAPADEAPRRTVAVSRALARGFERRAHDDGGTEAKRRPTLDAGFAAQFIAQELLSDGLYHENFRPALTAYAAADSHFESVRRPPRANIEIWA